MFDTKIHKYYLRRIYEKEGVVYSKGNFQYETETVT